MIDFILNGLAESQRKGIDYVLLKKVIVKKLQGQHRPSNRLTTFRQKNELSRAFLKRIASELAESQVAKTVASV